MKEEVLFTASGDGVVLWSLTQAYAAAAQRMAPSLPLSVATGVGQVEAMAMDELGEQLAVAEGSRAHVFGVGDLVLHTRLEGHAGCITTMAFCRPPLAHVLVSASEDRSFKVWDLQQGSLLHDSGVLTAAPLTSLVMDPAFPRMVLGAADGVVRVYDLSALPGCRQMQTLDLHKALRRLQSQPQPHEDLQGGGSPHAASGLLKGPMMRQRGGRTPLVIHARPAAAAAAAAASAAARPADNGEPPGASAGAAAVLGSSMTPLALLCGSVDVPDPPPALRAGAACAGAADELRDGLQAAEAEGEIGTVAGLLDRQRRLVIVVACTNALLVLDSQSFDVLQAAVFSGCEPRPQEPDGAAEPWSVAELRVDLAAALALAQQPRSGDLLCTSCSLFGRTVSLVRLTTHSAAAAAPALYVASAPPGEVGAAGGGEAEPAAAGGDAGEDGVEQGPELSVFPCAPPPQTSPLLSPALADARNATPSRQAGARHRRQDSPMRRDGGRGVRPSASPSHGKRSPKPCAADQPVTFHRKVKSSGYGMVQPKTRLGSRPAPARPVRPGALPAAHPESHLQVRQYPMDAVPAAQLQLRHALPGDAPVHTAAALRIAYAPDGGRLASCSADKTARMVRLPLSRFRGEGSDFLGHDGAVSRVSWNTDGTLVLTASADRSAGLWLPGRSDPLLSFSHVRNPPPRDGASASCSPAARSSASRNPPFKSEVTGACFFHTDDFVLLSCSSRLYLYRYRLCHDRDDDLARLRGNHRYRLAGSVGVSAQTILSLAAPNAFVSHLALCAGSNRSVEVVDLAVGRPCRVISSAHDRAVHFVELNPALQQVTHPQAAYDLFLTASTDSCLKLWDLRSRRCARRFSGHLNRQLHIGAAFSPCLRFVACGSEDRSAFCYDLRMGTVLHRLRDGIRDDVCAVAYHPAHPQLALGCMDGRIRFFSDAG